MNHSEAEILLGNILGLDISRCEVNVCLAALDSDTDGVRFQRVPITDDLADNFGSMVGDKFIAMSKAKGNGDLRLLSYNPAATLGTDDIERLDLSGHESIRQQISLLSPLAALDNFQQENEFISGLRFYVIVVKPPDGEPVYVFRNFSPKRELSRSRWFGVIMNEGQFDRYNEQLYLFDSEADCFSRGDCMYILNKNNFHKIFRFLELLKNSAKKTLRVIGKQIPIDNFNEFETACMGDLQKVARLNDIAGRDYLKIVTLRDIRKVIKKYALKIPIKGNKLCFESSDKWAILRVLDDDYLDSIMTRYGYEATSKRLVKGKKAKKPGKIRRSSPQPLKRRAET